MDEFKFDGFRFDGVSSMLYHSHGIAHGFSGSYDEYFGLGTDTESFVYMMMANYLIHNFYPEAVTIAEVNRKRYTYFSYQTNIEFFNQ
jgi:1,4-alpha-glucan branching enzyme